MRETRSDIKNLNTIISRSIASAGAFLHSSFEIPSKTLSAEQITNRLNGVTTLVLGTVSSTGKPRVAPVAAIFYRAAFFIPTVTDSLRARHVRNNPEVSLSLYEGNDFAVIVHGRAVPVGPEDAVFADLVDIQVSHGAGDVREWGDPIFLRIEAGRVYSFARYPEHFPGRPLPEIRQTRSRGH